MEALEPEIQAECRAAWESNVLKVNYEDRFETKNQIKRRLYVLLMEQTGKTLPWGTLTGIRPTKIAMTKLAEGGYTGAGVPLHEADVFYQQREDQFVH